MDKKIKDLLDKINYNSDNYKYFNDVKINKIVVSEDKNIWNIHLNCLNTIRFDILKEFIDKLSNYVNKKYKYELTIESNDEDLSLFDDYYKNILILINNHNLYFNMFGDRLIKEDSNYFIEVYNKVEHETIKSKLEEINSYFKKFGFKTSLDIKLNENKRDEIQKEIEESNKFNNNIFENKKDYNKKIEEQKSFNKEKTYRNNVKKEVNENCILGYSVKDEVTKLSDFCSSIFLL